MTSDDVWTVTKNGKPRLRSDLDIYGRVDKGSSFAITSTNLEGKNHQFVDDVSSLSKKTKNEIVDLFKNSNKRVVYLVKTKNDNKRG